MAVGGRASPPGDPLASKRDTRSGAVFVADALDHLPRADAAIWEANRGPRHGGVLVVREFDCAVAGAKPGTP